ncbi:recombinase family protein [Nonomuraea glycinis]|uniref:recombinase family protein n=1 Tax=Nonomuraea glycinis TaxID=2047744 RepID=UPI0033A5EAA0
MAAITATEGRFLGGCPPYGYSLQDAGPHPNPGKAADGRRLRSRYTGHQVWNKQRKDEILLDIENVALGTTTKQRWNTKDQWIWSEHPVHDAIVSIEEYQRVQEILATRARGTFSQRPHPHTASVRVPGCAVLRVLRASDAGQLEQPAGLLPVPFPCSVRHRR